MKARTESNSESYLENDSFNNFLPTSGSDTSGKSEKIKEDLNEYSNTGSNSKVSPSAVFDYTIISDEFSSEKEQRPLHFKTNEVLEDTPPILKSLNSCCRGPETFVYLTSTKSAPVLQNDDPSKTFVITSAEVNSVNQTHDVNKTCVKESSSAKDNHEYLSYIIERNNKSELSQMNHSNCTQKSDEETPPVNNSKNDGGVAGSALENSVSGDWLEKWRSKESEFCDKSVQYPKEKTAEEIVVSFDKTITGRKEQAFAKLQDELQKAHRELKLKDEEVTRLTRIKEDIERELEELTASLFQEAHKMVSRAKEKQAAAEKSLKESQMKVDVLTAEVVALKTLVLTSTPSRPNPHLHPQIGKEDNSGGVNLFNRKHRRSPSHFNLKYGRENSPPESPVRDEHNSVQNTLSNTLENRDLSEVDPHVHKEFLHWTLNSKLDKTDPFIDRIYREDINLCLDFSNRELAEEVQKAIETRNIYIEAVTDKSKTIFPRKCALLEITRQCQYRMKLGDEDTWYNISQMCRNRIAAVCDFINYLRYIELGLVKSSAHEMYWEIMRLRKEMMLARLGLSLPPP